LLQAGDHDREQLEDDRSRDVWVDPHRKDGEASEGATRKHIQKAEDVAAPDAEAFSQRYGVDAGDGDKRTDAKHHQQRCGVDQLATEVADAQGVAERVQQLDHLSLPTGRLGDLRRKLVYTAALLVVFRIGS